MRLLRWLGAFCLLFAVIAFVSDTTWARIEARPFAWTSLERHWQGLSPATFAGLRRSVTAAHPMLWTFGLSPVLSLPSFALAGGLGTLLCWLGRRRRQIDVFAN
jgi:hypothetical protein